MSIDIRKQKGLLLFQSDSVSKVKDTYIVRSQNSSKTYRVSEEFYCSCPDSEFHGITCKHAFAVRYFLNTEPKPEFNSSINKRRVYSQDWPAYNKSQQEEKEQFQKLLGDLVQNVDEPAYSYGRRPIAMKDLLFAGALKVYTQFSLRRFKSDLKQAKENKLVSCEPCFATVGHFIQKPELTPILQELIAVTASPLKGIETDFAIDSSGFTSNQFNAYCNEKHHMGKSHQWLKAHICVGVKTNIVTAVEIDTEYSSDSKKFKTLVVQTSKGFEVKEVSADKAYLSHDNFQAVQDVGGQAFIPFKKGSTGKSRGTSIWRKMFLYFMLRQDEFLAHYHKRSNVETTFHMIKSKFNDRLKSKTFQAQVNELLLKVLCHNIVVIIHETNELGITNQFDV